MKEFLNQALTPIVEYVCNQSRSIWHLFSTIEYTPLKDVNMQVLNIKIQKKNLFRYIFRVVKEYC